MSVVALAGVLAVMVGLFLAGYGLGHARCDDEWFASVRDDAPGMGEVLHGPATWNERVARTPARPFDQDVD